MADRAGRRYNVCDNYTLHPHQGILEFFYYFAHTRVRLPILQGLNYNTYVML